MHGLTLIDHKLLEFETHCNKILEMKLIDDMTKQLRMKEVVEKAKRSKGSLNQAAGEQAPAGSPVFRVVGRRTVSLGGTLQ